MVTTKKVTIKFSNSEVAKLERIAEASNTNRHALIRSIVTAALSGGDFPVSEQVKTPETG